MHGSLRVKKVHFFQTHVSWFLTVPILGNKWFLILANWRIWDNGESEITYIYIYRNVIELSM